jgi:hypothetical protein
MYSFSKSDVKTVKPIQIREAPENANKREECRAVIDNVTDLR